MADANAWSDSDLASADQQFRAVQTPGNNAEGDNALQRYKDFRSQGQSHDQAGQSAMTASGWGGWNAAPQPSTASGAPTTPVTASGQIPPPAPPTPPAVGSQNDARTANTTAPMPTYQAATFQNTLGPQAQISQFHGPDQSNANAQQTALMNAIMANPQTMDANTVAQMKEAQKEQALLLGQQNMGAYTQAAIGRGTLGSGQTDAFRMGNNTNVNNAVLSGNRSTDLAAIAANRQDQLNALSASSGLAQDQLGRATSAYGTGLQGQLAQDSSNLSHANFGLGVDQANANQQQLAYQSQAAANNAAAGRAQQGASNAQSIYGQDVSARLGQQTQALDLQKFLEQQQEFQQSLANNKNQFGQNLGLSYDQLGQNGNLTQQQMLLNAIAGR